MTTFVFILLHKDNNNLQPDVFVDYYFRRTLQRVERGILPFQWISVEVHSQKNNSDRNWGSVTHELKPGAARGDGSARGLDVTCPALNGPSDV